MKIAQLLPYDVDYHGGVREVVFHLTAELERRGHETTVFAPASGTRVRSLRPRLTAIETKPVVLPVNGSIARVIGLDQSAWRELVDAVTTTPFDVVHMHEPMLWLPLLFARYERTDNAYVGTFHAAGDPGEIGNIGDLAEPVISNLIENMGPTAQRRFLVRLGEGARSATSRVAARLPAGTGLAGLIQLGRPIVSYLLGRLDASVAVSRSAREFAASYGITPDAIIPNGVDVEAFARPVDASTDRDARTVLFFSRLEQRKGLDTLLAAMPEVARHVPGARLVVAGNFAPTDESAIFYRRLATERQVDVEFVASPTDAEKVRLFRTATVLCAPALGQESFGIILVEALAAGLPIVASDLAAFRDVLDGGNLGLLAPPGDERSLAAALARLLTDASLRGRLSRAGRIAVRQFAWDVVADRTLDIYVQARVRVDQVPAFAGDA